MPKTRLVLRAVALQTRAQRPDEERITPLGKALRRTSLDGAPNSTACEIAKLRTIALPVSRARPTSRRVICQVRAGKVTFYNNQLSNGKRLHSSSLTQHRWAYGRWVVISGAGRLCLG